MSDENNGDLYIARLDMFIKPAFVNNKFIDAVSWNIAIEAAAKRAEETTYDAGSDTLDTFTISEIRKLKK